MAVIVISFMQLTSLSQIIDMTKAGLNPALSCVPLF